MTKKILYAIVAAVALTGCDDTWTAKLDNEGQLSLKDMGVNVITTDDSRADIDVSDFIVQIKSGDEVKYQWTYSSMPEIITLGTGDYTAVAYSHEVEKQEWEHPYYLGSKAFTIEENKITNIGDVVCYFKSIKVTIEFDDELREHMSSDSKVTVVANNEGTLTFTSTETRAGYFAAIEGSNTLVATFEGKIDGYSQSIPVAYTDVTAGMYYKITYSIKQANVDTPTIGGDITTVNGISVDATIETQDEEGNITIEESTVENPIERPGNEDPVDPVDPVDPSQPGSDDISFDSATLQLGENATNSPNVSPACVTITSVNGFKHLNVTISSTSATFLQSAGELMPLSFDLVDPGTDVAASLASIGLPVGVDCVDSDGNEYKASITAESTSIDFDITALVPLLSAFPGTHKFSIEVVDHNDESNSTVLVIES